MKKRTSRSASETRRISSPSGTSAETVDTESAQVDKPVPNMASVLASISEQVRQMTPEEFKQSLVRTGIIWPNGELKNEYKQ
jgi:hypothetical protein